MESEIWMHFKHWNHFTLFENCSWIIIFVYNFHEIDSHGFLSFLHFFIIQTLNDINWKIQNILLNTWICTTKQNIEADMCISRARQILLNLNQLFQTPLKLCAHLFSFCFESATTSISKTFFARRQAFLTHFRRSLNI